jgi:hypothetical protein
MGVNSISRFPLSALLGTEALFAVVVSTSVIAQEAPENCPELPQYRSQVPAKVNSSGVISPDGSVEAHLGPAAFEDGLYVKNLATGEDKLILDSIDNYKLFSELSFSADGKRLLFSACPPAGASCPGKRIYSVQIDGSDLTESANPASSEQHITRPLP